MLRIVARILKIIFYSALVLIGVTFAISNRTTVDLKFYPFPYETTLPLFVFTIVIFIFGLLIGWTIARFKAGSFKRAHKQATKRVAALENELGTLRTERLMTPGTALPQK